MGLRRLQKRWKWTRHWLCFISDVSESPYLHAISVVSILWTFHAFHGPISQCNWWCWCETSCPYVESEYDIDFSWFERWVVFFFRIFGLFFQFMPLICWTKLCLLRYRQSNWRRWCQRYCRSVESEFNIGGDYVDRWKYCFCLFFIHLSSIRDQKL